MVMIVLMFMFLDKFIPNSEFWDGAVVGAMVTLFIGVIMSIVGGLMSTMGGVSQDAPPPVIPAGSYDKTVEQLINRLEK